ncbi:MAG: hypothetical protein HZY75_13355 [Nocardioidaceae bacterium]|nr:MAG: hypothetical protein HZY75_13355 [Nocardioidaceae bacterium]
MKPLVEFGDPETLLRSYLEAVLADETPVPSVSTEFPDQLRDNQRRVQIQLETSDAADWPVTERAQVRVTVHAPSTRRSEVKSLASRVQGHLYRHPGSAELAACIPMLGRSSVVTDPTTHNLMVWFLCRAILKPIPVSA